MVVRRTRERWVLMGRSTTLMSSVEGGGCEFACAVGLRAVLIRRSQVAGSGVHEFTSVEWVRAVLIHRRALSLLRGPTTTLMPSCKGGRCEFACVVALRAVLIRRCQVAGTWRCELTSAGGLRAALIHRCEFPVVLRTIKGDCNSALPKRG